MERKRFLQVSALIASAAVINPVKTLAELSSDSQEECEDVSLPCGFDALYNISGRAGLSARFSRRKQIQGRLSFRHDTSAYTIFSTAEDIDREVRITGSLYSNQEQLFLTPKCMHVTKNGSSRFSLHFFENQVTHSYNGTRTFSSRPHDPLSALIMRNSYDQAVTFVDTANSLEEATFTNAHLADKRVFSSSTGSIGRFSGEIEVFTSVLYKGLLLPSSLRINKYDARIGGMYDMRAELEEFNIR
ncbi:MAG: hypothetical protein ACMXYD_01765 [Candidatus Woesearchaeota archaeon]